MELARAFAYSLAPIAVAYNLAHFINLLLIQGQLMPPLASDPFGYGWDLLGTAGRITRSTSGSSTLGCSGTFPQS